MAPSGKVTLDSGADAGIGFVATGSNSAITAGLGATVVDVALAVDSNSRGGIGHESPFTGTGARAVGFFGGIVTAGNTVGLMLAETEVAFTPARLGAEVGVAPEAHAASVRRRTRPVRRRTVRRARGLHEARRGPSAGIDLAPPESMSHAMDREIPVAERRRQRA